MSSRPGQDRYELRGDLTIKGNTHPVVLEVMKYGEFNDPAMMGHRIAYSAHTQINRKDYGLSFNMVLDGRFVVSEQVQITIEGELVGAEGPGGTPPRLDQSTLQDRRISPYSWLRRQYRFLGVDLRRSQMMRSPEHVWPGSVERAYAVATVGRQGFASPVGRRNLTESRIRVRV